MQRFVSMVVLLRNPRATYANPLCLFEQLILNTASYWEKNCSMGQKLSRKHHYLPRYYLKGFSNSDGTFFVYDKETGNIFTSIPGDSFFENHLNTINFSDGSKSDFLEHVHTELEGKSWESFDNIRTSNLKDPVQSLDKMHLYLFLHFLHWRLPSNYERLEKLSEQMFINGSKFDYFNVVDNNGNQASEDFLREFKRSAMWKKCSQLIIPFAPFFKDSRWIDDIEKWRFYYTEDNKSWYIVGDNPIISSGD